MCDDDFARSSHIVVGKFDERTFGKEKCDMFGNEGGYREAVSSVSQASQGFGSGTKIVLVVVAVVLLILFAAYCVKIVPQATEYVIERFGMYSRTWGAGIHVKIPLVDRIAKKISLKEKVYDFPPQPVITKDNVTMQIDSVVFCKVFDSKLYVYGVENPISGLQNLAATTLRNLIGELELDETLTSRDKINAKMQAILDEATDAWGIKVTRVELKSIIPPAEIEEVMTKQMKAERERRQTVLEAQAHQEAVVSRAEGDKKAKLLAAEAERDAQISLAEGRARSIELVYQAQARGLEYLNAVSPSEAVLKLKGLEALRDVADGQATKIYMPSDLAGIVASLGIVGDSLGFDGVRSASKKPRRKDLLDDPCVSEETGKGGVEAAIASEAIMEDVEASYVKPRKPAKPDVPFDDERREPDAES